VVLRIYELKASAHFDSADFVSLYEKDQAVLGADIVVRDEFVIQPGEIKTLKRLLGADTKFVGVVAAFREIDKARWRAVMTVMPNKDNLVTISLDGIAVRSTATIS